MLYVFYYNKFFRREKNVEFIWLNEIQIVGYPSEFLIELFLHGV
jgi:hypothetical protein